MNLPPSSSSPRDGISTFRRRCRPPTDRAARVAKRWRASRRLSTSSSRICARNRSPNSERTIPRPHRCGAAPDGDEARRPELNTRHLHSGNGRHSCASVFGLHWPESEPILSPWSLPTATSYLRASHRRGWPCCRPGGGSRTSTDGTHPSDRTGRRGTGTGQSCPQERGC